MSVQAGILEKVFAKPPVTRDQIKMLGEDNVCGSVGGLTEIFPMKMLSLEEGARYYL
jgi:hypothetical protein